MSYTVQIEVLVEDRETAINLRDAIAEVITDMAFNSDGTLSARVIEDDEAEN